MGRGFRQKLVTLGLPLALAHRQVGSLSSIKSTGIRESLPIITPYANEYAERLHDVSHFLYPESRMSTAYANLTFLEAGSP